MIKTDYLEKKLVEPLVPSRVRENLLFLLEDNQIVMEIIHHLL